MRAILTTEGFTEMALCTIYQDPGLREFGKKENVYNKITYSATVSDFSRIIGSTVRCQIEGIIPVKNIPVKMKYFYIKKNIIYTSVFPT